MSSYFYVSGVRKARFSDGQIFEYIFLSEFQNGFSYIVEISALAELMSKEHLRCKTWINKIYDEVTLRVL